MKDFTHFVLMCSLSLLFACSKNEPTKELHVIPQPNHYTFNDGSFLLNNKSTLYGDKKLENSIFLLDEFIKQTNGLSLSSVAEKQKNQIQLSINRNLENEEYILEIKSSNITIEGQNPQAVLWGIQTLRQIISNHSNNRLPNILIKDKPRFKYRGMHLDVGRHMFPTSFIKKYIDILSLHKINNFHWHLTEDQGWRIEIKKYPKLTEIGGFRKGTIVGHHGNSKEYDGEKYGGFYTQKEIKEVVQYAMNRGINVIPEIELPGHALAALSSYPQFGCTGGPYEAAQTFGVFEDVYCAGNDATFNFLEDILDEVITLFPSKYIHIGGDECPKSQWKKCSKCQSRISKEGLKDEHELQSYFVQRIEKYINSKGKRMIGWDEILEGGLAPNATVMSWRGTEGGIAAAKEKHDVIMTPGNFVYFDHYQNEDITSEPLAVGGYTSVKEVYGYEPIPNTLTDNEKKFIIGVQGNVWTEYMKTSAKVEYMTVPRIAALSEIAWTSSSLKNWDNFKNRLNYFKKIYDLLSLNYAKHLFNVVAEIKADTTTKDLVATLESTSSSPIYYTLDGTTPSESSEKYLQPIHINKSLTLKATITPGHTYVERKINFHKAAFKPLDLQSSTSNKYFKYGTVPLNDGLRGSLIYNSGTWVGFNHGNFNCIINLEEKRKLNKVTIGTLIKIKKGIFGPKSFRLSISNDGENFKEINNKTLPVTTQNTSNGITDHSINLENITTQYLKIEIENYGKLPEWHSLKGKEAYIFIDEIIVQ